MIGQRRRTGFADGFDVTYQRFRIVQRRSLRHTCACLAIAAGADIKVLQRMLGHSSATLTLDRYGHLMPGQAEAVAARLDQLARAARASEETDGDGQKSDAP